MYMSDINNNPVWDVLLIVILTVKIVWILSLFSHFISKEYFHNNYEKIIIKTQNTSHDIFTLLIGILLIYLYNHLTTSKVCIEGHAKMYLYSYGILSCVGSIQKTFNKRQFSKENEYI
jgi:hypothetical protein